MDSQDNAINPQPMLITAHAHQLHCRKMTKSLTDGTTLPSSMDLGRFNQGIETPAAVTDNKETTRTLPQSRRRRAYTRTSSRMSVSGIMGIDRPNHWGTDLDDIQSQIWTLNLTCLVPCR